MSDAGPPNRAEIPSARHLVDALQVQRAVKGGELVRLLDLVPGQRVQGTVLQVGPNGDVLLGLLGGPVRATTNLVLQPGKSYDLTVGQISPRIVLSKATPLILPTQTAMAEAGVIGPGGKELSAALEQPVGARPAAEGTGRAALQQFLSSLAKGQPGARDIESMHRLLGHDQEARVLRLAPGRHASAADVAALRQTYKAELITWLANKQKAPEPVAAEVQPLRRILQGLAQVEVDNSNRAEQGAPQWLPLPVPVQAFLRDARMFLVNPEREADTKTLRQGGLTIVLLLDLSRLGAVRVDLHVQSNMVAATFRASEASTVALLGNSKEELTLLMEERGLRVSELHVRWAGADGLPVGDLITPPSASRDPDSLVDLHA